MQEILLEILREIQLVQQFEALALSMRIKEAKMQDKFIADLEGDLQRFEDKEEQF